MSSSLLLQTMSEETHLKLVRTCSNMLVESCVHPIICWLQGGSRPSSLFRKSPSKGVTSAISGRRTKGTKHSLPPRLWYKTRYWLKILWPCQGVSVSIFLKVALIEKILWKKHMARSAPSGASLHASFGGGSSHWCGHRCLEGARLQTRVKSTGQLASH